MAKIKKHKVKVNREKIFEYNPDSKVIRWRYVDEDPNSFGWPNYGRIIKTRSK